MEHPLYRFLADQIKTEPEWNFWKFIIRPFGTVRRAYQHWVKPLEFEPFLEHFIAESRGRIELWNMRYHTVTGKRCQINVLQFRALVNFYPDRIKTKKSRFLTFMLSHHPPPSRVSHFWPKRLNNPRKGYVIITLFRIFTFFLSRKLNFNEEGHSRSKCIASKLSENSRITSNLIRQV